MIFVTEMASQPPPINRAKIPEFLEKYSGICAKCEIVKRVFSIYQGQNSYSEHTDLGLLIDFIIWCESSMTFSEKYTDTYIKKLFVGGEMNLNHKPVLGGCRKLYTTKGVNVKKFHKYATMISEFRHEVYMSLFSEILEFEENDRIRRRKELFDSSQCGNSDEVRRIMENRHPSIDYSAICKAFNVSIWNEHNDVSQVLISYLPPHWINYKSQFRVALARGNLDYIHILVSTGAVDHNDIVSVITSYLPPYRAGYASDLSLYLLRGDINYVYRIVITREIDINSFILHLDTILWNLYV